MNDVYVQACQPSQCIEVGYTGSTGAYSVSDFPAGQYTISFYDTGYVTQQFTTTLIAGANSTQNVTMVASPTASISGTVDNAAGTAPISDTDVELFTAAGVYVGDQDLDESGSYTFSSLAAGTYQVEFAPGSGTYVTQWYSGSATESGAQTITLADAEQKTGIDADLALVPTAGTISGTITGADTGSTALTDITASLLNSGGFAIQQEAATDGTYSFTGIAPGQYTIEYQASDSSYEDQWWSNKTSAGTATVVTVTAGSTLTANVVMQRGNEISGTVTDDAGNPVAGITVYAWGSGTGVTKWATTAADGTYTIYGLVAGTYSLDFRPNTGSIYAEQWYSNQITEAGTTTLRLTGNTSVTTGKDAVLHLAGSISGTVTSAASGTPMSGQTVYAWDVARSVQVAVATTDSDGNYTLSGLGPDSYQVEVVPQAPSTYSTQWWNDVTTEAASTAILIIPSQEQQGVNFALGLSLTAHTPTISGTTTVGSTLTAATTAWAPAPVTISYQWNRGGVPIPSATGATYQLTNDDAGQLITVTATGTKAGGYQTTSATSSSKSITGGTLTATPVPTISGSPIPGATLTAVAGTWTPATVTLRYQWYSNGAPISRATTSTYSLTTSNLGNAITVEVTGSKTGFTSVTETSGADTVDGVLVPQTPTISGTDQVGQTLTASSASWGPGTVALSYTWTRDGVPIDGATASTYILTNDDAGTQVAAVATGTELNYTTASLASSSVEITGGSLGTVVPTVSGQPLVGQTLSADGGTWTPAPVALSYQWLSDGTDIQNATDPTYLVSADDAGSVISVQVTGTKDGFTTTTATSLPTELVDGGILSSAVPTISGTAVVGQTLSVDPGSWAPVPVQFTYQWLRDGVDIPDATDGSYVLTNDDAGAQISVQAIGSKAGYTTATTVSAATDSVTGGTLTTEVPLVAGVPIVGNTLTATTSAWSPSPVTITFQWQRGGVDIPGATDSTYQLANADADSTISVVATGTKVGFTTANSSSASTTAVTGGILGTVTPTISGTAKAGHILTATAAAWTPAPVTLTYSWQRNGVAIPGSTDPTYTVESKDQGKTISVAVTGTKDGFTTTTLASSGVKVKEPASTVSSAAGSTVSASGSTTTATGSTGSEVTPTSTPTPTPSSTPVASPSATPAPAKSSSASAPNASSAGGGAPWLLIVLVVGGLLVLGLLGWLIFRRRLVG